MEAVRRPPGAAAQDDGCDRVMTSPDNPTQVKELYAIAQQHAIAREFDKALAAYLEALQLMPDDPDLLLQVSYMLSLSGQYRNARDYALRAHAKGTTRPEVMKQLLSRLRTFNEVPAMQACIERMLPMSRITIPMLIAIAAQLAYVGLPEKAIKFLDEARRGDADYPATLLSRAHVLLYLGRFDEAARDLARVIKRAPHLAQAYWLQSQLRRQSATENHVAQIVGQCAAQRTAQDMALLCFALHKELDDLGRHDEAWQALQRGCASKRRSLTYQSAQSARTFAALQGFRPRNPVHADARADPSPIFIVGMHRSGTTLLEQLLDGHPDVRGLGELYDFTSAMREATDHHCAGVIDATIVERADGVDFSEVGARYLAGVAWRLGGERHFIDKLPSNFMNLGFICEALPGAKVLHMVRDPMETCFSNLRELFSDANPYSYDLTELADFFIGYRRLMEHWHQRYPGRILDVDYARLTLDPETEVRRVCDFVGLDFEPAMLQLQARTRSVVTASAVQVRSAIKAQEAPKWRAYEAYLQPLKQRLAT
ncbi:MAG: sulfotransferase family protein [Lysobacteraceae bacterium]|nr:MAG: sulfotransferase family protein [Xanthomonadaceae bacterium]